jgi:serine/threonine-protein kinase RsbW
MSVLAKTYSDLDHALDEVRAIIDQWSSSLEDASDLHDEPIQYTQLVLHEWIANLLQHADFADRNPAIRIRLTTEQERVRGTVEDNSAGFDLTSRLPTEDEPLDELPERGMGLRIINACTDHLSYHATEEGLHRFEFSIPADHDPWVSTLF